ncbi:MAG: CRISPR-associated protein Cas4 [Rhodospirillaceae bacterium]
MSDDDDSFAPLSALQHLVYCPRQCALIHLEQAWAENRWTAEGRVLHEKVDEIGSETRGDLRIARGLTVVSRRLGLSGRADVVEFRRRPDGVWQPFPVEYKRGRPKTHDADRVQLCAQALCLEEMLGVLVPDGALFYGQPRRREAVSFDSALRDRTESLAAELARLFVDGKIPPPVADERCTRCSLAEICGVGVPRRSARRWLEGQLEAALAET